MVRIATRGSALALWQARWVAAQLALHGAKSELVVMQTQGDREQTAFAQMQGQGFFTKAVQDAVLERTADLAVHSYKDLPSAGVEGLTIGAVPVREDSREMLLVRQSAVDDKSFLPLKKGAKVGSSAVRRQAQLRSLRPDLELKELRGNVPTRIQKLRDRHYDAIVLAWAGVRRLGLDLSDLQTQVLPTEVLVPAPAQGALAIECRSNDQTVLELLLKLDDPVAKRTVQAERGLMARLAGGCQLALGASAQMGEEGLELLAWYGGKLYHAVGSKPEAVVEEVYVAIVRQHPEAAVREPA
ncbi:MAG: hydroxymethylbilane synthase [Meiothermus sp.]|nr:hydroxymethylbilane synthase [Meiothermus sp.]